jgi:hypothetical protein
LGSCECEIQLNRRPPLSLELWDTPKAFKSAALHLQISVKLQLNLVTMSTFNSKSKGMPLAAKLSELRKAACLEQGLSFNPNPAACPHAWRIQYVNHANPQKGDYIEVLWAQSGLPVMRNGNKLTIAVGLAHRWDQSEDNPFPNYDVIVGEVNEAYPTETLIACKARVGIRVGQQF